MGCLGLSRLKNSRKLDTSGFGVTGSPRTRLGVTSGSLGSRKLGSESLRAQENLRKLGSKSPQCRDPTRRDPTSPDALRHCIVLLSARPFHYQLQTCQTSSRCARTSGLTKHAQACVSELFGRPARPELGSGSLRSHLSRENSVRGHFGVTSGSLGSRNLGSKSLRGRENLRKLGSKSSQSREN